MRQRGIENEFLNQSPAHQTHPRGRGIRVVPRKDISPSALSGGKNKVVTSHLF
jgi:hypothetical protein